MSNQSIATHHEKSVDELAASADRAGLWTNNIDGTFNSLRAALVHTAQISAQGRTPYKLQGPDDIEVGHWQMLQLWKRLGIVPGGIPN